MYEVNELPAMDLSDNETGCCPRFNPTLWDDQVFTFKDKKFAKFSTKSLFYIPINFGKVMTNAQKALDEADAMDPERYLMLSEDVSKWKGNHHFMVDKDVEGAEMETISGTFMTKVYDGAYKEVPTLINRLRSHIEEEGKVMKHSYVFYTTCPKCAKHYGHNYMVLFGEI